MALAESTQKSRSDVRLTPATDARLRAFAHAVGEKTKTKSVERLLNIAGLTLDAEELLVVATYEAIMSEPAPSCIVGKPFSGKSYSLRLFLLEIVEKGYSVIIIDPSNEHFEIGKKCTALTALSKRFKNGAWHITLEKDPEQRKLSIERVFEHLHTLALKGKLQNHIIAIDEAGSFADIPAFRNFLSEGRKHARKIILTSVEHKFSDICVELRPIPFKIKNVSPNVSNTSGPVPIESTRVSNEVDDQYVLQLTKI
ncbi:MAG: type IV secretory system conjugative DNA transfer family protein [Nitrososphaerales archaeon]